MQFHSGGQNFSGIGLQFVKNVRIENVTVSKNREGIHVSQSEDVTIKDCRIINNDKTGVLLSSVFRATIIGNNFTSDGLRVAHGWDISYYNSHTIANNTVNNKPLLFYKDRKNVEINGIARALVAKKGLSKCKRISNN